MRHNQSTKIRSNGQSKNYSRATHWHDVERDLLAGRFAKHGIICHHDGYLEPSAEIGSIAWARQQAKIWTFQENDPEISRRALDRIMKEAAEL